MLPHSIFFWAVPFMGMFFNFSRMCLMMTNQLNTTGLIPSTVIWFFCLLSCPRSWAVAFLTPGIKMNFYNTSWKCIKEAPYVTILNNQRTGGQNKGARTSGSGEKVRKW
jgi:uncharacterized membrane protein YgcG